MYTVPSKDEQAQKTSQLPAASESSNGLRGTDSTTRPCAALHALFAGGFTSKNESGLGFNHPNRSALNTNNIRNHHAESLHACNAPINSLERTNHMVTSSVSRPERMTLLDQAGGAIPVPSTSMM